MTDMVNMTKAEILDIWKGFVRNMTDQGAVVPFAHEIARRVRGELLDRLEVAEKERELWAVIRDGIITPDHLDAGKIVSTKLPLSEMVAITNRLEAAEKERDEAELMSLALRAKIEQMERQEPVAWLHETRRDSDVVTDAVKHVWGKVAVGAMAAYSIPLYALPGAQAQPAPSVPECPYPCGWRNLLKHAIEDGAYLARSINEDEPVTENARAVTMRMVMRLRDVLMAINNAAPEAKP